PDLISNESLPQPEPSVPIRRRDLLTRTPAETPAFHPPVGKKSNSCQFVKSVSLRFPGFQGSQDTCTSKPKMFPVHAGTFFSCPDTIIIVSLAPKNTLISCPKSVKLLQINARKTQKHIKHKITKLHVLDTLF